MLISVWASLHSLETILLLNKVFLKLQYKCWKQIYHITLSGYLEQTVTIYTCYEHIVQHFGYLKEDVFIFLIIKEHF